MSGLNNPMIATMLAPTIAETGKQLAPKVAPAVIKEVGGAYRTVKTVAKVTVACGLLYVGISIAKQKYLENRRNRFLKQKGGDTNVKAAIMLHKSMFGSTEKTKENSSFFSFVTSSISSVSDLVKGFGTDEDLIFQAAAKITSKPAVNEAYKILYNRNLETDLVAELTNEEQIQYEEAINGKAEEEIRENASYENLAAYKIGETVYAAKTSGTSLFDYSYKNSRYIKEKYKKRISYGQKIGEIRAVLPNDDKSRISYLVCHRSYCSHTMGGFGLYIVDHREIKTN